MRYGIVLLSSAVLLCTVGCGGIFSGKYQTEARKENGLVVILPGIEGEGYFNHNIRQGLINAGCYRAITIYNWGVPIPGIGLLVNQTNVLGNRMAGKNIAQMIEKYQIAYPGRPVYIVAHSGGGGVAIFTAEAMRTGQVIDGIVLLSASISADYNLRSALRHCRKGILNIYNPADSALLRAGTMILGNVDGGHGASAGLNGFVRHDAKLQQPRVPSDASARFGGYSHDVATSPGFVAAYVAPYVLNY
jgi:pimeloyl-ACP methyl ester carboxylesterase